MAVREVNGPAGAPWERPLGGALDRLVIESEALASNPLGDPNRRPLYVYRSPGVVSGAATDVPAVYVLQGFSGQVDMWLSRPGLDLTDIERLDALWATPEQAAPDAVVVFVDAWTSLGGSQFLNSSATGNYTDYICDEIVPFVDARYPIDPSRRAVAGKSSGGYGAMVLPMLRPGIFSALATHCGDALFEVGYVPDFPKAVRALRDGFDGSYERFLEAYRSRERFDYERFGDALNMYAMAACYSPDPSEPTAVQLPFDVRTGRLVPDVWQRWLEHDPVRMAPNHAETLRALKLIYIDAGLHDEYHLDLGAQAFADTLGDLDIGSVFELYPGGHRGTSYRYPPAIRRLLEALSG
jgi:S-formylglutathione hydrolase FrmB